MKIRDGLTPGEWLRVSGMTFTVVSLNVVGWGMLALALGHHYRISKTEVFGVGTGILAYTLGMRHAFDADHIAAIDNTTRKLVNEGKRPLSVGFFFISRALLGRVRPGGVLELRHPLPRQRREQRTTPRCTGRRGSSAPRSRARSSTSSPP